MALVNLRIKVIGKRDDGTLISATSGVCIRPGNEWPKLLAGHVVALNEEEAKAHLKAIPHALEITEEEANVPSPPGTQDAPKVSGRVDQILDAVMSLDRDNPKNWTKAGIPQVSALEKELGYDITQRERDEAWEKHKSVEMA